MAAGAPAVVYRVPAGGGKAEVAVQDGRPAYSLPAAGAGWDAVGGERWVGVIYQFRYGTAGAKPFAVYAAARREITALAMDAAGNVYAAGVGTKGQVRALPPLPVTGSVGVTITFAQPGSATAAGSNTLVPDGSEIYRIAADGSPEKLLTLKDDVVYALAVRTGVCWRRREIGGGCIAWIRTEAGRFTDVAHLEAAQGMAFAAVKDGLLVATSNSGKVFRLEDAVATNATYTSEVFDAQGFSQWGRAEVRAGGDARALICLCGVGMWRVR